MDQLGIEQAHEMVRLQAEMNSVVNPHWLTAGYPFLRAVVVEVGEAMDHVGWKWWKQQDMVLDQVQIELVDILHFYLSAALIAADGDEASAATILTTASGSKNSITFDSKVYRLPEMDLLQLLELLAGLASSKRLEVEVLEHCFERCALGWNAVFKLYVSKNVLNIFRQTNGYKEGSYVKIWNGEEDNIVLSRLLEVGELSSTSFAADLYNALTEKYQAMLAAK